MESQWISTEIHFVSSCGQNLAHFSLLFISVFIIITTDFCLIPQNAMAAGAAAATPSSLTLLVHKSQFLGQPTFTKFIPPLPKPKKTLHNTTTIAAKFNLYEILGGRGLCNGEAGLEQELKKSQIKPPAPNPPRESPPSTTGLEISGGTAAAEDFEKELMGMTGGFPGGERGLQKFVKENPPPPKKGAADELGFDGSLVGKPKPPELPMLLPGMIAIVKNPKNPFYMYCGIVQRITDGKAGVLFEGGNWDRLVTFRLEELERREKGPPMVSPKSAILEELVQNS